MNYPDLYVRLFICLFVAERIVDRNLFLFDQYGGGASDHRADENYQRCQDI